MWLQWWVVSFMSHEKDGATGDDASSCSTWPDLESPRRHPGSAYEGISREIYLREEDPSWVWESPPHRLEVPDWIKRERWPAARCLHSPSPARPPPLHHKGSKWPHMSATPAHDNLARTTPPSPELFSRYLSQQWETNQLSFWGPSREHHSRSHSWGWVKPEVPPILFHAPLSGESGILLRCVWDGVAGLQHARHRPH